jgi:uncharacterized membrane protein
VRQIAHAINATKDKKHLQFKIRYDLRRYVFNFSNFKLSEFARFTEYK